MRWSFVVLVMAGSVQAFDELACKGCFARENLSMLLLLPILDGQVSVSIAQGAVTAAADLRIPLTVRALGNDLAAAGQVLSEGGFDAAVVWATRSDPAFSIAVRAAGARAPILTIGHGDTGLVGEGSILDIGTNDTEIGATAASYLLQSASAAPNGSVVCVRDSDRAALLARCEGARTVFGNIVEIVVESQSVTIGAAEFELEYAKLQGTVLVLSTSVGASRVVKRALQDKEGFTLGCVEVDADVVDVVRSGMASFAVDTVPYNQGYYAVHLLSLFAQTSNKVANRFINTGSVVLTKNNLDEYSRLVCLTLERKMVLCPDVPVTAGCECMNRSTTVIAMNQHESPFISGFWSVPAAGVHTFFDSIGRRPDPPALLYNYPDFFDPEGQAALIAELSQSHPHGFGVTVPHPIVQAAVQNLSRSMPLYTFNAGDAVIDVLGTHTHFGQLETVAGRAAGRYFAELGAKRVLCLNHNIAGYNLIARCEGVSETFGNNSEMLAVPGETDIDGIKTALRRIFSNDLTADAALTLNANVLVALTEVANELKPRYIHIGSFDLNSQVAEYLADGVTSFTVHQGPYLQGYLTSMFLTQGILSQSLIQDRVIHTGPGIITAENYAPFLCEEAGYPVCPPPDPPAPEAESSAVNWGLVVGVAVGVLVLILLPILWHCTANWRKMRRLLSAVAIAETTAEGVAKMEFEDLQYLRLIERPTRLQTAFIVIIDLLEQYKSFLPHAVLINPYDQSQMFSPVDDFEVGEFYPTTVSLPQGAELSPSLNPLNPGVSPQGGPHVPDRRGSTHSSVSGASRSSSVSSSSPAAGSGSAASPGGTSHGRKTPRAHVGGLYMMVGEYRGRKGSVFAGQLITTAKANANLQMRQANFFVAIAVDLCKNLRGVTTMVGEWDGEFSVLVGWNAHQPCSSHAHHACELALNLTDEVHFSSEIEPTSQSCVGVSSGKLWFGNVGITTQRFPILTGEPVQRASRMASLCERVRSPALCHAAVYEQVRSRVRARVVDVILVDGKEDLIYELSRGIHSNEHELYVQGFSALRTHDYVAAVTHFSEYLESQPDDMQAMRLLRLAAFLKENERYGGEAYARRLQPPWVPFEEMSGDVALPEGTWRRSVTWQSRNEQAGEQSASLLQINENNDASLIQEEVRKTLLFETPGDGKLPVRFTDSRGRDYHRSKRCLGRGAFGEVWLGMGADGGMVAVKSIKIDVGDTRKSGSGVIGRGAWDTGNSLQDEGSDSGGWTCSPAEPSGAQGEPDKSRDESTIAPQVKKQLQEMVQEVQFMSQMQHENIVQYLGCAVTDAYVLICMEYLPGGSLAGVLQQFDGSLPESSVVRFVRDIIQGLSFIHEQDIVHRDLKPANVLMTVDGGCKLADFGASAELQSTAAADADGGQIIGTPMYMPPEQANGKANGRAAQVSDIWSLGIVVVELCTGSVPWPKPNNIFVFIKELGSDDGPTPTVPASMPGKARALAVSCLHRDMDKRPSAHSLLSHPYILS
eukprot:Hpha_TRINITY_DN15310_c0_g2::TRINITY_DN15310_c0_g2_i1::g.91292::m.91292